MEWQLKIYISVVRFSFASFRINQNNSLKIMALADLCGRRPRCLIIGNQTVGCAIYPLSLRPDLCCGHILLLINTTFPIDLDDADPYQHSIEYDIASRLAPRRPHLGITLAWLLH